MGDRFGRYELLRRLGTGGMAEVFLAKTFGAEGFVKELVIKRILPVFNADPEFVRMFTNEARLAVKLQHANIVQIYDFNQVEGIYYIAMEWVDGPDLRSVLVAAKRRAMPVPLRVAVHIGVETLKGLHHAHCKSEGGRPLGLVHRDISPHNLLVSFSGEVKIADFGIAKAAAFASATRAGTVKGKLAYMSPEQVTSGPVDARSDLFSVGVVLWELLAGHRLYQADSEAELFAKVRRAEVPPLQPLNPEVPPELEQALLRLLAPLPAERFQNAEEALGQLSRFAEVGDALRLAGYLRRLLPAEAGRELGGDTLVDGGPGGTELNVPAEAAEQATTRTRRAVDDGPGTTEVPTLPDRTKRPTPGTVGPQPRPASRARPLGLAAAAVACFALSGIAAHLLLRGAEEPPPATVSMLVETAPPGAMLWADDLPLGTAPLHVHGSPGRPVRLRARWGAAVSREGVFSLGAAPRVDLVAPAPGSRPADAPPATAPSSRPVATTAPARPPRTARAPRQAPGSATIDVLVSPWARVRIDNEEQGQTPLKGLKVSSGPHLIEIANPGMGKAEKKRLRLRAGEHLVIRRYWSP